METIRQLYFLLTPSQRRSCIVLLGIMLFGSMLETLGVALVIPAVSVMTQPEVSNLNPVMGLWFSKFGSLTQSELVVIGVLSLVLLHTVKAGFLLFVAWKQSRFVYGMQAELSQRMFAGYLMQPWTFHLQRNSALLIRNITGETDQLSHNGFFSGMSLLTELMVVCGISILLVIAEPLGALVVVSVLGVSAWGYQRLTKRYVVSWGLARQYHEGQRILHLQQGLGGVKDVKLLGRESVFHANYSMHNRMTAKMGQRQTTLQQVPRLWLELLAVSGLAMLVLIMIGQKKPMSDLVPTLGLFAAAAFRLMPSVTRILSAVQGLRYGKACIETLYHEVRGFSGASTSSVNAFPRISSAITVEALAFRYADADNEVLTNVNLHIPRGSSVGFIGGSGSGKSSLVDILLGLLPPSSGKVCVDGVDIRENLRGWQDQIGYVPQAIFLTDDTLRRNIAFGISDDQIDEVAIDRAIRAAQLDQFFDTLPEGLETVVGERGVRLSGGQRQRVGIARALYHDPAVLVMDEATSALDNDTEASVMTAVNAMHGQKTLVIVAHRLSTVAHCDRVYRFESGAVMEEMDFSVPPFVNV